LAWTWLSQFLCSAPPTFQQLISYLLGLPNHALVHAPTQQRPVGLQLPHGAHPGVVHVLADHLHELIHRNPGVVATPNHIYHVPEKRLPDQGLPPEGLPVAQDKAHQDQRVDTLKVHNDLPDAPKQGHKLPGPRRRRRRRRRPPNASRHRRRRRRRPHRKNIYVCHPEDGCRNRHPEKKNGLLCFFLKLFLTTEKKLISGGGPPAPPPPPMLPLPPGSSWRSAARGPSTWCAGRGRACCCCCCCHAPHHHPCR
jgi:hypothetical protein